MGTFLFNSSVFGPIHSRRFGASLGVNLLPNTQKYCNFNCIYCECGATPNSPEGKNLLPTREAVQSELEQKLQEIKSNNGKIDIITFAGNGEPTLHPNFSEIIDDTIALRNNYFPNLSIAVLSNAIMLKHPHIYNALLKIDKPIFKLDAGLQETFNKINQSFGRENLADVVKLIKNFTGHKIVQIMFAKNTSTDNPIDNTTEAEITAWLKLLKDIAPQEVMIYSLDRDTPTQDLCKISPDTLTNIANMIQKIGIPAKAYF